MYYNNELTFRGPPDRTYRIKIDAYQVEFPLQKGESNIDSDYLWRYIAYGAALDILNDYREFEVAAQLMSKFLDYKAKVYARTYQQQQNQRSIPSF